MKTYGMARKINLGKFGLQYESLDLMIEGCSSFEEAEKEINEERIKIENGFKEAKKPKPEEEPFITPKEKKQRTAEQIVADNKSIASPIPTKKA